MYVYVRGLRVSVHVCICAVDFVYGTGHPSLTQLHWQLILPRAELRTQTTKLQLPGFFSGSFIIKMNELPALSSEHPWNTTLSFSYAHYGEKLS